MARFIAAALACALLGSAHASHDGHLVAHISGGVGLEEREAFLARRSEFNVHLVFAQKKGEYVADVETLIAEEHDGHVILKLVSDGPFLFVKLNPGHYALAVTYQGNTQRRDFVVPPAGGFDATFLWQ